jgi:O-antigen ligase
MPRTDRNSGRLIEKLLLLAFVFSVLFFSYQESTSLIPKLLSIPLVLLFLFRLFFSGERLLLPAEFKLLGAWLVVAMLSGFFALDFNLFLQKLITLFQVLAVAYIVFHVSVWIRSPAVVWFGIFVATLAMSYVTLMDPAAHSEQGRATGTVGNANLYGLALIASLVCALDMFFSRKSKLLRLAFLASVPLLLYMLGEAGSRKAMIAVPTYFAIVLVLRFKSNLGKRPGYALVMAGVMLAGLVGSVIYLQTSKHFDRMELVVSAVESGDIEKAGGSAQGRLYLYKRGLEIAAAHPALGVGLDNFRLMLPGYSGTRGGTYAHSNFVEMLADTGVVGFLLYFSIYVSVFRRLWRSAKRLRDRKQQELYVSTFALMAIYVVYDFAMVSYSEKLSWLVLASIIAAAYLLDKAARQPDAGIRAVLLPQA